MVLNCMEEGNVRRRQSLRAASLLILAAHCLWKHGIKILRRYANVSMKFRGLDVLRT